MILNFLFSCLNILKPSSSISISDGEPSSNLNCPCHLVATVLTRIATTAKAMDSTSTICWAWFSRAKLLDRIGLIMAGWWLGHPSEKYESQLGWGHSQYMGKCQKWQPNHQPGGLSVGVLVSNFGDSLKTMPNGDTQKLPAKINDPIWKAPPKW